MQSIQSQLPCSEVARYLQQLIQFKSITPNDAGALAWLSEKLVLLDFEITWLEQEGVRNFIAKRTFGEGPNIGFCGHVDVVPANNKGWYSEPFSGQIIDQHIYGRGAADMKGAIAAMLRACELWLAQPYPQSGSFYWLITSDEEGEAEFGTKMMLAHLAEQGITLDACLVGEPSCENKIGDTIKNGRRGALSGHLAVYGKAGHVAYPELASNAAHQISEVMQQLLAIDWQKDNEGSKTSLQITDLNVPNPFDNLVPAVAELRFNIRYSHSYQSNDIHWLINQAVGKCAINYQLTWQRPCEAYYNGGAKLNGVDYMQLLEASIVQCCQIYPALSTSGGTSDGRFFSAESTQVFEFGLRNFSIHQVNERVALHELEELTAIYCDFLHRALRA
ncbi:succinyl-diaminopimelate desuccinylase [Pseudoalteromonas tunicata]|jgi:succinyl-diaminopimelate desuccinylase|uniref:Succinyl-diaminopimelate desuccinylase n=1 Tax=Pseudoalteromonas tunicata D2 TaxID=87626 RepID=A4C641_9GAMM|nr:succinyl-diaminopimelate desuccinylase [Pseudoalteromonas tunicata]AXT32651.1 succinyl-diaminopimelate desuccinylase [Pseudoalteromonas tunicata]EAR29445.1 succinyl-diaminopimelate desuccinylase [Pseudoalteromonas tunicata D2]MDP4985727.1 succinyl-diaminopimelate desuccinylase [Pseudoalteromonas tunicata]MDP5213009.1 succinyl-diaminopimelate desuccinylase [Pseudoalteromonas tunicata]